MAVDWAVKLSLDIKSYIQGIKAAKAETQDLESKVAQTQKAVDKSMNGAAASTGSYNRVLAAATKQYNAQHDILAILEGKMKRIHSEIMSLQDRYERQTEAIKDQEKSVAELASRYEAASNRVTAANEAKANGERISASAVLGARNELKKLTTQLDEARARLNAQRDAAAETTSQISSLGGQYAEVSKDLTSVKDRMAVTSAEIAKLKAEAASTGKTGIASFARFFGAIRDGAAKAVNAMHSLDARFRSLLPQHSALTSAAGKLSNALNGVGNMARRMLVRMAIKAVFQDMGDAMKALANDSARFNSAVSSMLSAAKTFGASIVSAFAPLIQVVSPIITSFANQLTAVANRISQVIASITGQTSWMKAVPVTYNYAKGLDATSKAADKASKSTDKAKKSQDKYNASIMGFDEIHALNAPDEKSDTSSATTGSTGASGGAASASPFQFVEENIGSKFAKIADEIKAAWEKADFSKLGAKAASGLNGLMTTLQTAGPRIRGFFNRIVDSATTFINGFVEKFDMKRLGTLLGNGFTSLYEIATRFISGIDWKTLGTRIAEGISGLFSGIRWGAIAEFASEKIKAVFSLLTGFIQGIDWAALPGQILAAIGDFFDGFDWAGMAEKLGELLGAAVRAAVQLVGSIWDILKEAWGSVKDYFAGYIEEAQGHFADGGMAIIQGIWNGITDALVNAGNWLYDNIFLPIWNGIKKAFGIASPSKKMAEIGGFIIDGLWNGLTDAVTDVFDFFSGLVDDIFGAFDDAKNWLFEKGGDIISGLSDGVSNTWENVKSKFSDAKDFIVGLFDGWKDIGKTAIENLSAGIQSIGIKLPHFDWSWSKFELGGFSFSIPEFNGISWYAKGGFPEMGELFVARENGPELVGEMGGRTTVANNEQIVEGIKRGVEEAMRSTLVEVMAANSSRDAGDIILNIDGERIARATMKGQRSINRRYGVSIA